MEHPNTLYLPIIRASWRIAWRERRIWVFAFLAGLMIGSGIGSALIQLNGADGAVGWFGYEGGVAGMFIGGLWTQAQATGVGAMVTLGVLTVLILTVMVVAVWAVVVSVAAIILGTEPLVRGTAPPMGIGKRAMTYAWPVFLILLVVRVGIAIAMAVWRVLLLWNIIAPTTLATVIAVIAFILLAGILSVLHIATPLAVMGVVLDRMQPLRALRDALVLIRERWLLFVEFSCILTIANIAGVLAWMMGSFIFALPFAFLVGIGTTRGMPWLTMTSFAVGGIVLVSFTAIAAMVVTTFLTSAWTTMYLRLTGSGEAPEPWIRRLGR